MKKVVVTLEDNGNLVDDNGTMMVCTTGMSYVLTDFEDMKDKVDVAKLMGLGATADDLIKLKATGVI